MKYFTPAWWAMEVESTDAVVQDYWRYIDSIRPHLTAGIRSLLDDIALHDSKVRRFAVDIPSQTTLLLLDGFVDPWNPPGTARRRFSLLYQGVTTVESTNDGGWVSEHLDNSDLGYHEIEFLAGGTFEHRMLFASGIELILRFRDLQVSYEPLPETDAEPCAAPNGGPATPVGDSDGSGGGRHR